jgi:hypothetical protein
MIDLIPLVWCPLDLEFGDSAAPQQVKQLAKVQTLRAFQAHTQMV